MSALDLTALEKEALSTGGECSTLIGTGEGLVKVIVFGFKFNMHPPSDENFTVTTSYSIIDLL